jgi:predicted transposase YdaD
MVLTTFEGEVAIDGARGLIDRAGAGIDGRAIIDLVTTIMVDKFNSLTRDEVDAMLGIELKETRVYQDAKAEGREQGHEEGRVEEARVLLLKQLTHKLGELSLGVVDKVNALSIDQLESLGVALFDLSNVTDLNNWLNR